MSPERPILELLEISSAPWFRIPGDQHTSPAAGPTVAWLTSVQAKPPRAGEHPADPRERLLAFTAFPARRCLR